MFDGRYYTNQNFYRLAILEFLCIIRYEKCCHIWYDNDTHFNKSPFAVEEKPMKD